MPVRKGKNARSTKVHDTSKKTRRSQFNSTRDWFDEQFENYFGEAWDPANTNKKVEDTKDD